VSADRLAALIAPEDPVWAYMRGQMHPSQGPLLEAYARESEATIAAHAPMLDLAHGPHPRETFDLYVSPLAWRGTIAYFHAGYWQSRDKSQFRFLAPSFLARGIDVALVNTPLCPDVTLARLTESAREAILAVLGQVGALERGGAALTAAGHSAGGHLAVELAMTDWAARGHARSPIASILAISGVYELAPLLATPLNDKLRLDADEAAACSPLRRAPRGTPPPALFVVGGLETPAFHAQSEAMHEAWRAGGGRSALQDVANADHFGVLRAFAANGAVFEQTIALVDQCGFTDQSGSSA
jgi:arylformamidase